MATIPLLSEPLPTTSGMTEDEFDVSMNLLINELNPFGQGANAVAAEVAANALAAEAAVAALANAVWVSGTTYVAGDVRYSPADFLNYRRKTGGAGTTDPSIDTTNWQLLTSTKAGGSDTTSSAVDITLTSTSGRLQVIAMTVSGKKVTQPAASALQKGAPVFVYKNAGNYRFAVHKNGGGFMCYVEPGQVVAAHCSDISSGPGVWQLSGQDVDQVYGGNTAEVLNAVDSRNIAVAMLSPTKAICAFRNNSTGYLNAVVLNYGSASGTPVAVNAEASTHISVAAQTSSQATVVYKLSAGSVGVTKGYVLDISGTTITPGSVATIDATAGGAGTGLCVLSSTKLLCVYQQTNTTGTLRERVLDISASAITASAEVAADATAAEGIYMRAAALSATKALTAAESNTAYHPVVLRLQSISGSTPAPTGSALSLESPNTSSTTAAFFGLVILSTTRALVVQGVNQTYSDLMISLIDISGTTPVLLRSKLLRVGLITTAQISAAKLDANNAYVTWTGGGSLGVDALTVKATDDDQIIVSSVADKLEAGVTSTAAYLACDALDASHVMQVSRNASTYLSAKTIELAA